MIQFTKAKPKVQDYNPLTHTSFYNQKSTYSTPLVYSKFGTTPQPLSPEKSYKPIERTPSKNIFAQSGSMISRAISMDNIKVNNALFSKTRPRNRITDPISGEVKIFNIDRPRIESLDISSPRDKISSDYNLGRIREFQSKKNLLKPQGTVSGSLRKEVPGVAYVDPFILKSTLNKF